MTEPHVDGQRRRDGEPAGAGRLEEEGWADGIQNYHQSTVSIAERNLKGKPLRKYIVVCRVNKRAYKKERS